MDMLRQFITNIYNQSTIRTDQVFTVYFHFTEDIHGVTRIPLNVGFIRISLRIRWMSPVVVVDDVSPVVKTCDVDRIRYRGSGVVGVPKTHHSVLFVCCVGDVHRESQEKSYVQVVCI